MKYTATIVASGDSDNIEKIFRSEDKDFMNRRSSYEMEVKDGDVVFTVSANDATALRATLDSISKGLKIYDKMGEIR